MKKQIKQLFVQDLVKVQGGTTAPASLTGCPEVTTLACGEERPGCGC